LKLHSLYILRDQEHQDIESIEYELLNTMFQLNLKHTFNLVENPSKLSFSLLSEPLSQNSKMNQSCVNFKSRKTTKERK